MRIARELVIDRKGERPVGELMGFKNDIGLLAASQGSIIDRVKDLPLE